MAAGFWQSPCTSRIVAVPATSVFVMNSLANSKGTSAGQIQSVQRVKKETLFWTASGSSGFGRIFIHAQNSKRLSAAALYVFSVTNSPKRQQGAVPPGQAQRRPTTHR